MAPTALVHLTGKFDTGSILHDILKRGAGFAIADDNHSKHSLVIWIVVALSLVFGAIAIGVAVGFWRARRIKKLGGYGRHGLPRAWVR